jgi:hypothetical protein
MIMNKSSETDWARVDALTEAEIDTSDIPPITDEQFSRSRWWKSIEPNDPLLEDEMRPEYDWKSLRVRKLGPERKSFGGSSDD